MDVIRYGADDVAGFAEAVRPLIQRDPAAANILATVLDQAVNGAPVTDGVWLLVTDGAEPVCAGMRTPPFNLFLSPVPGPVRAQVLVALVDHLLAARLDLPGVTGLSDDSHGFANLWTARTGRPQTRIRSERLYELSAVPPLPQVPGTARLIDEPDIAQVAAWMEAFNLEATPDGRAIDGERAVRYRITRGQMLIWTVDGEPVSMAGLNRGVAGVSRIGPVYTPPLRRGRGYGSAVTTAASRLAFDQGSTRCMLYADVANPTSNAIYQAIGYRPVAESAYVVFG
jgi:predicted GNAT family acetyltransferase